MSLDLELYSILKGTVARVQPYGAFIKFDGTRKNGLVHISQMTNGPLDEAGDMVAVGDEVFCKVINIEPDGGKIALSMKVVNQTTGADLDPNQVQTSLDEQRRKKGGRQGERQRIELGAVLNTTCKKCGGTGHLAGDCFFQPGTKSYELLPDMDEMIETAALQTDIPVEKKKHKKKDKKKHKKKKSKKHKDSDSDSSSSDSETDRQHKKRKKSHKKEKKKRSKKHKKQTSDSSSDTDSSTDSDDETPIKRYKDAKYADRRYRDEWRSKTGAEKEQKHHGNLRDNTEQFQRKRHESDDKQRRADRYRNNPCWSDRTLDDKYCKNRDEKDTCHSPHGSNKYGDSAARDKHHRRDYEQNNTYHRSRGDKDDKRDYNRRDSDRDDKRRRQRKYSSSSDSKDYHNKEYRRYDSEKRPYQNR